MEFIHINKKQVKHVDAVVMETVGFPDSDGRKWDIKEKDARYRSLFGAPLLVITAAWQMIKYLVCDDYEIKHLLWGLVFLKVYAKNQTIHCSIVGWPTVKEFSSRSWYIIRILAEQKNRIVTLQSRFEGSPPQDPNNPTKIPNLVADCADFHIDEPFPWHKKWVSRKFNGPGLKYFVAIAIHSNNICYAEGPEFATRNESRFVKETLLLEMPDDEPIEVDAGPKGDSRLMGPDTGMSSEIRKKKSILRARCETIFSFIKSFQVMDTHFHHRALSADDMMENHKDCFDAVVVITQLKFMLGVNTLFDSPDMTDVSYSVV